MYFFRSCTSCKMFVELLNLFLQLLKSPGVPGGPKTFLRGCPSCRSLIIFQKLYKL